MAIISRIKLIDFIKNIKDFYFSLLNIKSVDAISSKEQKSSIGMVIYLFNNPEKLLQELKDNKLNFSQSVMFSEGILDSFILSIASSGKEIFNLGRLEYLKGKTENLNKLLLIRNQVDDYLFAKLIQAYYSDAFKINLSDYKDKSSNDGDKVCDFVLELENELLFIECKNIHVGKKSLNHNNLVRKIEGKINQAKKQMVSTHKKVGKNVKKPLKYVCINLSCNKIENLYRNEGEWRVYGYSKDKVEILAKRLKGKGFSEIDIITLSRKNTIFHKNTLVATVIYTKSLTLGSKMSNLFSGISLEYYPIDHEGQEFQHARISRNPYSLSYYKTTWNNLTDPQSFYTVTNTI